MYTFTIDQNKRKLMIKCAGFFKKEEAEKFVSDLEKNIRSITPENFDLVIDAREQKPSSSEVLSLQEKAMEIYLKTPFRNRYSVEFDSATTKSQIQRLGKGELLQKFNFVNSLNEAIR